MAKILKDLRRQIQRLWRGRLTAVQFLALTGGILLMIFGVWLLIRRFYPMDFEADPITSLEHLFQLYAERYWLAAFSLLMLALLGLLYLKRMQDVDLPIKISLWPVALLYGSFFYLLYQSDQAMRHFDYSFRFLGQLGVYLTTPTKSNLAALIPPEILVTIRESKQWFYVMISSYFFLFLTAIVLRSKRPTNRFGVQHPSRKLTEVIAAIVLGLFLYSSLYIVKYTILEDPFHFFAEFELLQLPQLPGTH